MMVFPEYRLGNIRIHDTSFYNNFPVIEELFKRVIPIHVVHDSTTGWNVYSVFSWELPIIKKPFAHHQLPYYRLEHFGLRLKSKEEREGLDRLGKKK